MTHKISDEVMAAMVQADEDLRRERDELRAENERLRAELALWKPAHCGKIFPLPVPGEVVKNCAREYGHDGAHQTETGEVWVFTSDKE